ncbi:PEP-CTERM sorting domain-containing protein [Bowmanella denitrificans]|uniref:PEP-CTERM sorting domain-containing protein n=1 Tax=Bowmanella denitrificans TaxID=366582 RepID=UPI000C9C328D|nr:PEP-CTERM sorting domain-containing protein [Bowmanella denitrificans]
MKALLMTILLAFSSAGQAALLTWQSDQNPVQVGDSLNVQLRVSDFNELLGGFSGQVSYALAGLELTGWQFGDGFDDGLGSLQMDNHNALAGTLTLDDYADLFADALVIGAKQGTDFVLATLSFRAISAGLHSIGLDSLSLVSFDNQDLLMPQLSALTIQVQDAAQVPVPATLLLLASGLLLLRRRL